MKILECLLLISYLNLLNVQSQERINNDWQKRLDMEPSQGKYSHFASLPLLPQRKHEHSQLFEPLASSPYERPPTSPIMSLPLFETEPLTVFEAQPLPSFENPVLPQLDPKHEEYVPKYEHHATMNEHYDPPAVQPYGISRRQGKYNPLRHNMVNTANQFGPLLMNPTSHSADYPSQWNGSPISNPIHHPLPSPCDIICGTSKSRHQPTMYSQHATDARYGKASMSVPMP